MDCGDTGGEPAFSAEKTRSRSQKERNRERGELWTLLFFSKYFIEVWLIFSVGLISASQQSDSVICIHVSLSQRYPSHLGCHITEWNSPCYTLTRCWLSILNRAMPTTLSWRFNSGTLRSFLQPTLTLFGHSRIGWVTYSGSPSPLVSP